MSQAALRLEVLFEAWLAEGRELRLSDRLELLLVRAKLLPVKAELLLVRLKLLSSRSASALGLSSQILIRLTARIHIS